MQKSILLTALVLATLPIGARPADDSATSINAANAQTSPATSGDGTYWRRNGELVYQVNYCRDGNALDKR